MDKSYRNKVIGQKLQQEREAQGLTRKELSDRLVAEDLHILEKTLVRIEAGERKLTADELPEIAGVLGVSVLSLFSYDAVDKDAQLDAAQRAVGVLRHRTNAVAELRDATLSTVEAWSAAVTEALGAIGNVADSPLREVVEGLQRSHEYEIDRTRTLVAEIAGALTATAEQIGDEK